MSSYASEAELGEFGEYGEYEGEGEFGEFEGEYGAHGGAAGPLSEAEEIGLASELLEVNSEAELEQFLGGLINKIGGFFKSPIGQSLGGILKGVAKKALPMVGGALGSMVAPGIGTAIGGSLGSMASNLFELETMPAEQAEFETARRVVGLTAAAASNAAQMQQQPGMNPNTLARAAVMEAAREHAPGLYRQMMHRAQQSGRGGRSQAGRPGQRGTSPQAAGQPGAGRVQAGRTAGARRPSQQGGRPSRGPQGHWYPGSGSGSGYGYGYGYDGDSQDVPFDASPDDYADVDGDPTPFYGSAGQWRPVSGRWVRRGRRIVLLGI